MIRIPKKNKDLRNYILKKVLLRTIGFLIWLGFWWGGAVMFNYNHRTWSDESLMKGWKLWMWMGIAAVTGALLFRVWQFFTRRSFSGLIVSNDNSRSYTPSEDPKKSEYDFRLNTKLKVRLPDGGTRRIRFEQKDGFYTYFHEGNEIMYFRGLPYPINTDPTGKNGYICVACGTVYKKLPCTCEVCKHSVIDPKQLWAERKE